MSDSPSGKTVVLGVTGSIAAYKAADLASRLVKRGHEVRVVMTNDAQEFITPLTLQVLSRHPVTADLYDEKQSWHPGHIDLADRAPPGALPDPGAGAFRRNLAGARFAPTACRRGTRCGPLLNPAPARATKEPSVR